VEGDPAAQIQIQGLNGHAYLAYFNNCFLYLSVLRFLMGPGSQSEAQQFIVLAPFFSEDGFSTTPARYGRNSLHRTATPTNTLFIKEQRSTTWESTPENQLDSSSSIRGCRRQQAVQRWTMN